MIRLSWQEAARLGVVKKVPAGQTRRCRPRRATPEDVLWQEISAMHRDAQREFQGAVPGRRYKNAWNGGITCYVPSQYTSQTCAACGHVDRENRKSQADFHCIQCGHQDNADVNAAKNILARGHRVLACGEVVHQDASVKQEPTETQTQGVLP